jgi:hypothetical protein
MVGYGNLACYTLTNSVILNRSSQMIPTPPNASSMKRMALSISR